MSGGKGDSLRTHENSVHKLLDDGFRNKMVVRIVHLKWISEDGVEIPRTACARENQVSVKTNDSQLTCNFSAPCCIIVSSVLR